MREVDFLVTLGMRFFLQRLVRLLGRNGNQKTWARLKWETENRYCSCKCFREVWENKNVFWEVGGGHIFVSKEKELCFQRLRYERDRNGECVEI